MPALPPNRPTFGPATLCSLCLPSISWNDPLKVDFSRSDQGGLQPLQAGFPGGPGTGEDGGAIRSKRTSPDQFLDDLASELTELLVATGVKVGELVVIQSK